MTISPKLVPSTPPILILIISSIYQLKIVIGHTGLELLKEVMNSKHHDFIVYTDKKLDECESPYPFVDKVKHEWTMWIDAEDFRILNDYQLELVPVVSDSDYESMVELRQKIEIPFGYADVETVKSFVRDIRLMAETYSGQWYLAKYDNIIVGEIGIVPFEFEGQKVGRLKDVDILPDFQGKGLGNQLLSAACTKAKGMGLKGLCLTADADNWPKNWYLKFGFKKAGEVFKD